jgi:DNA-binding transcriptional ArsR family regulator
MHALSLLNVAMKSSRQMHVILKALAEPRRVAILTLVRSQHELRAGEIARHFRSTRPGISQHLRVLTNAGLLCERRQGTSRLYSLRRKAFGELRAFLDSFWEESLSRLKREVEDEARRERSR